MIAQTARDAFAAMSKGESLGPFRYAPDELQSCEVSVAISHCGICHSDLHLIDDDWKVTEYPFVPGHEIVGTIVAAGGEIGRSRIGERIGVGWLASSCMNCPQCFGGNENLCRSSRPTCVDGRIAIPLPGDLASEYTAPLLCAGITMFAPLRRARLKEHSRVGVVGLGGLGHLAVQFAKAMGCVVTVFSTTAAKADEAHRFGADRFVDADRREALAAAAGSCDLILATAPVDLAWAEYVRALKPNGALCIVGAAPVEINIPAVELIDGHKTIAGGAVGSNREVRAMLRFSASHGIAPAIELFPMAEVNRALDRLRKNQLRYRAVLVNRT